MPNCCWLGHWHLEEQHVSNKRTMAGRRGTNLVLCDYSFPAMLPSQVVIIDNSETLDISTNQVSFLAALMYFP